MPSIADSQDAACREACIDAIAAYDAARRDRDGRRGIAQLRDMRNKVMAHSYMEEVLIAMPTYNQVFRLADATRDVLAGALFAIDGHHVDLVEVERVKRAAARLFWEHALQLTD